MKRYACSDLESDCIEDRVVARGSEDKHAASRLVGMRIAAGFLVSRVRRSWLAFCVALLGQFRQPIGLVLGIVGMNQTLAVSVAVDKVCAGGAPSVRICTSTSLYRPSGLEASNAVCRHPFIVQFVVEQGVAVWIMSGQVEKVHAGEDDEEATQQGYRVHSIRGIETLEEDERRAQGRGGKRNVVEGVDTESSVCSDSEISDLHRCRELIQRFVEVIHLRQDAEARHNRKDICRRMGELVIPAEGELQCDSKRFDRHDGDGANSGADRDVDERVLFPVHRRNPVDHDGRVDRNGEAIDEETCLSVSPTNQFREHTRLKRISEDLFNLLDRLIRRRMQDNNNGPKQTHCATQFP